MYFDSDENDIAKVALFEFILGDSEEEKIAAFNIILKAVGVPAKLCKDNDKYLWRDCTNHSDQLAEAVFDELANAFSNKTVMDYMSHDRVSLLIDKYDDVIHNIKQRNETMKWITECDQQCAN